ncbi:translation initiation factor IF-3, partial [Tremellales sp. Uapishka_1]
MLRLLRPYRTSCLPCVSPQCRNLSHTVPSFDSPSSSPSQPPFGRKRVLADKAPLVLQDDSIPYTHVHLVSPTDNSLSPLQPLSAVLESYSRETHILVVVSTSPPIVKLLSKEDEKLKERDLEVREKLRRKTAFEEKELLVSWNSEPGDLQHKLNAASAFLEKGDRVQVIFANRKGGGLKAEISAKRKEKMVQMFDEKLDEIGKKWREDGKEKGLWVCFWQPREDIKQGVRKKVVEGGLERRKEKDEKKEARRRKEADREQKAAAAAAAAIAKD